MEITNVNEHIEVFRTFCNVIKAAYGVKISSIPVSWKEEDGSTMWAVLVKGKLYLWEQND